MSTFLKWFILWMATVVAIVIAKVYGVVDHILAVDTTHICAAIFGLFIFFSMRCGYYLWNHHKYEERIIEDQVYWGFQWANNFSGLGLIGTVIGLIGVMTTAFAQIDVGDQTTVKQALSDVGVGTGIALFTTLVGLVFNVLLKLQYGMLERHYDRFAPVPGEQPAEVSPIDALLQHEVDKTLKKKNKKKDKNNGKKGKKR